MSQWAEVRHLHLVEGVPKKEIAPVEVGRQDGPAGHRPAFAGARVAAAGQESGPGGSRSRSGCTTTRGRRIRRLLCRWLGRSPSALYADTFGAEGEVKTKEAFVHRSALPGRRVRAGAAPTLPYSNAYFASCSSRCSTVSSPPSSISGAQRLASSSITRSFTASRRSGAQSSARRPIGSHAELRGRRQRGDRVTCRCDPTLRSAGGACLARHVAGVTGPPVDALLPATPCGRRG